MTFLARIKRPSCLILLLCILLTLIFIFGNSLASKEASGAASDKVNDIVSDVIENITGKEETALENFFVTYSRKLAHVLEFFLLGSEICLLIFFMRSSGTVPYLLGASLSFVFASFDEGIQMLSGRGDLVSDIFIDTCGYLIAYLLCILSLSIFCRHRKRKHTQKAT